MESFIIGHHGSSSYVVPVTYEPKHVYEILNMVCICQSSNRLQDKISQAKNRVYLSTLYIGKTEHELISTSSPEQP